MKKLFEAITQIGVHSGQPSEINKNVEITNTYALALGAIASIYGVILLILGITLPGIGAFLVAAGFWSSFLFCYMHWQRASKVWTVLVLSLAVYTYSTLFGQDSGVHFWFLAAAVLPFALFDLKEYRYLALALLLPSLALIFTVTSRFQYSLIPAVPISAVQAVIISFFMIFFSLMVTFSIIYKAVGDHNKVNVLLSNELARSTSTQREITDKNILIESIVENIPVALFLKDAKDNFRITLWNRAAEQIFEVPRTAVIGKTTHDLWPKEHADLYLADDIAVTKNGVAVDIAEEPAATKARGNIILRTRKIPLVTGAHTEASYLLGICEDITEQKNAQISLIHSCKMASLGEMAGGIAHEINNPLAIISGRAANLRRLVQAGGENHAKVSESLKSIEDTVERIAKIIKGLRAFARSAEGDPMVFSKVSTIVQDTLQLCKERFKNHVIDLRVKCDPEVQIECRPEQIVQILVNLLGNAHDAVEKLDERWVTLDIEVTTKSVKIETVDSGKGIPKSIADKIMAPFFTTKDIGKGTGLGLSISKGIAEDHHGHLTYNAKSKNTSFVLELPLKQPQDASKAAHQAKKAA